MKIGYSLLLGEYVKAEKIDYFDCKQFQIVCPICKEPVFKVDRTSTSSNIKYLSHYEKDKSYLADCELRVNSLTSLEIHKSNNISRNQRLEHFLAVLHMLIPKPLYPHDEITQTNVKKMIKRLDKSKYLKHYRNLIFDYERKVFRGLSEKDILEFLDGYVSDIQEVNKGEFYKTSFSIDTQKRIAFDVWCHLLSVKAKANFFALFNHAYYQLLTRISISSKERELLEYESILFAAMDELVTVRMDKSKLIIKTLIGYSIGTSHAIENSNLFNRMSSEIVHEMLGILLVLPYFDTLKDLIQTTKKQN